MHGNGTKNRNHNAINDKFDFNETLKLELWTFGNDILTLIDLYINLVDTKRKTEKKCMFTKNKNIYISFK